MEAGTFNWHSFTRYDAVFFQRPATAEMIQLMAIAQKMGIPVWVDYDDYVFDIPIDNPAWKYYGRPEVRELCIKAIKTADIVTVSTEKLKSLYEQINPNITVIPNGYEPKLFDGIPTPARKKRLLWRGTDTHVRDLMEFGPAIVDCVLSNPSWEITFLGYMPWWITEKIKTQVAYHAAGSVLDYFRILHEQAPAVVIVPLAQHDFNESKSMIAWLEATLVGAPCLAPHFQEWRRPGARHYTSVEHFKQTLLQMMSDFEYHPETLITDVNDSRAYAKEVLSLDVTNRTRFGLLAQKLGVKGY